MQASKNVLTTGDVARICCVAPRTVSKWFDAGYLRGYRIPGSKDRRIPVEDLVQFMQAHGIPLNGLQAPATGVLIFDADIDLTRALDKALSDNGYAVATASSALEAGAAAQEQKPAAVLVDVSLPDVQPRVVSRFVRSVEGMADTCLIGMSTGLTEAEGQGLLQDGFDAYLSKPFEFGKLIELIEDKIAALVPAESS